MVQVVSAEVFELPADVTGHVTYKTSLTREGIWALTVGIIDPGWKGPVSTTLLNFSRQDHAITPGDTFLRVSFFEHQPVSETSFPKSPEIDDYFIGIQKYAMSKFPPTFLNKEDIAKKAGDTVLSRIRREALVWIGAIAFIFPVVQLGTGYLGERMFGPTREEIVRLNEKIRKLELEFAREPLKSPQFRFTP